MTPTLCGTGYWTGWFQAELTHAHLIDKIGCGRLCGGQRPRKGGPRCGLSAVIQRWPNRNPTQAFFWNRKSEELLFDADGADGAAAVEFARVNPGTGLSAADFVIF